MCVCARAQNRNGKNGARDICPKTERESVESQTSEEKAKAEKEKGMPVEKEGVAEFAIGGRKG